MGDSDNWAIRNNQYKLINYASGAQEFFDLLNDTLEINNLINTLSAEQIAIKLDLEIEASSIQTGWSCRDYIKNGNEEEIDCGGDNCSSCVSTPITKIIESSKIFLFPNPTIDNFRIQSDDQVIKDIKIYTASGSLIYHKDQLNHQDFHVDISEFSRQVYFVHVRTLDTFKIIKIMKY